MRTPEDQKIIDDQKTEIEELKRRVADLEKQIEEAKEIAEDSDEPELFEGIFD